MSFLHVYHEADGEQPILSTHEGERIAAELAAHGVRFDRCEPHPELVPDADQKSVLTAYAEEIERLKREGGFVVADVIGLRPDHPDKASLRQEFLDEHRYSEDEMHVFVRGGCLFYLHLNQRVYVIGCAAGDLISVPADTPHWFDMGPEPNFTAIRLFAASEAQAARMTGSDIASRFPRYEAFSGEQAA
ncbi:1,2-dihydroxy-3-keto-5-methylthiopentene dioxygenase [Modicisalibacter xianhensis]|uniref:Acireductone dioxygenase n=1 Tax=Modicisalibacter xianhensis TaxID=442341 RepID=A0A1I3DZZ8_9GAMM|nr:cupin [Halomonas xianhensis]SFH92179.1 1,2-dihydroxy-3-keto-5-methylthiopentene dioxygenase [Halomonas xianhensis]